ncbi:hypothetical protein FACS189449_04980 [Alphaproteobacteria bacterium]|nr:hypothetical protein FACS189449_04980 [Alphaproteobacteria bacterium]
MVNYFMLNLIDVTEMLASKLDLSYNRFEDDEITLTLDGRKSAYELTVMLGHGCDVIYFSCDMNLTVPKKRKNAVINAIIKANEQMWIGHFDFISSQDKIFYSISIPFTSSFLADEMIVEATLKAIIGECDRFYHYFLALVNNNMPNNMSIEALFIESAGEA